MSSTGFHRIAAGDYETRDGRYRLYRLVGVSPPAWNVERNEDSELIVDGAASKRDAVALFAQSDREANAMGARRVTTDIRAACAWCGTFHTLRSRDWHAGWVGPCCKPDSDREGNAGMTYVVEVFTERGWRKVRGPEGGPWRTRDRAERVARGREGSERRSSSTEGLPHRVTERVS